MGKNWNLKNFVFSADVTVDEIMAAINVFEVLKAKYQNDETIAFAIEILRDEICHMFGGSIYNDEE